MARIFTDECNAQTPPSLQIDFSAALWAINNLNDIFHRAGIPLNDVDFIAETDREIICVECKNSNRIDPPLPINLILLVLKKLTPLSENILIA